MSKTIIIAGSSRSDGATMKTACALAEKLGTEVVELLGKNIEFYDYEYNNQDDDFMAVSKKMLAADKIIFATPIYWYSMSAPLKVLFDRFSDLVRIRKEEGRIMKDKEMFVLVNAGAEEMPEYFLGPFIDTSKYFDMCFAGHHFVHAGANKELHEKHMNEINGFADRINADQCMKQAV